MGKNIFSEKVYLSGDKDALDYFNRKREEHRLLHALERIQSKEGIIEYNRYLLIVRDFLKSLDINSSLEYAIAISFLISKGYFSFEKKLIKDIPPIELRTRYGASIVMGYGVCRNYCDMTRDLMKLMDFYTKNLYCYQPNLSLPNSASLKKANHVISLIEYDGVKYGFDTINDYALYRFLSPLVLARISQTDPGKIRNKPYYAITEGECTLEDIQKELKELEAEPKKKAIFPIVYEDEIFADTEAYLKSQTKTFDDFHEETKDMKSSIVRLLTK